MEERRQSRRDVPTNAPNVGDTDAGQIEDEILAEEELERAHTGWRADDAPAETDVASNAPNVGELEADAEDAEGWVEMAADALEEMDAREQRRDQSYRSGGDDENPGFDHAMDSNAPKEADTPPKKRGGSRGQSDWN